MVLAVLIVVPVLVIIAVRTANYFSNRITTKNGIDEGIFVELGGQEQYLHIRGKDVNNPVIIWVHGGPASPDTPDNYIFDKYLVDNYTLVFWDQRGCGRTYFRNKNADPNNDTATFEQALADLDELVDYVSGRFHSSDIVVVGHSYGTLLGSKYAVGHPEKISAYIGVGQFGDSGSDVYSYEDALAKAKANGDDTVEMENAYRRYREEPSLDNMMALRRYTSPYHAAPREAKDIIWKGITSPHLGIDDVRWFLKQMGNLEEFIELNRQLFDYIKTADVRENGMTYEIPVGFISGECDWTTPVAYSKSYYNDIEAPLKNFLTIDGCGHIPQYDAPLEFCDALRGMLDEYLK